MSSIISSHNKKILNKDNTPLTAENEKKCNCQKKNNCPMNGNCLDKEVIYKCKIQESDNDTGKHYIGLTANTFKKRWYGHSHTFRNEEKRKSSELANHVWNLQDRNISPLLSWEIIDYGRAYINGSKRCDLCLIEKYHVITSKLDLVNKRSELISKCRHSNKFV